MNKKLIVVAGVAVIFIGGGILWLNRSTTQSSTPTGTSSPTSPASSNTSDTQTAVATITYADGNFSPSSVTVKSGDTVTIKNDSSRQIQFDSDPHPVHTDNEELNVGKIDAGQTRTFKVTSKGTFGYHDHLNPSTKGSITVQ